jgi:hypothetical protein
MNSKKRPLIFQGKKYTAPIGARCCDICSPSDFPVPIYKLSRKYGDLKRGKKRKLPDAFEDSVRTRLCNWWEKLVNALYPDSVTISSQGMLPDQIIEQLATCGEELYSHKQL